jgi:PadR family transcriptional regulator, regulatory protein PadR
MADRTSLGQFEQLVLAAILDQGDNAYGVTIHRAVEELMSPRRCQMGAVYATLDRMEDKGLVASWMSEPTAQRGGRAKRHYRLSAHGEAALKEAMIIAERLSAAIEKRWEGKPWKPA